MNFHLDALEPLAMVVARVTGVMLAAPIFSGSQVPTRVKVFFTLALSVIMFGALNETNRQGLGTPLPFMLLKLGLEIFLGLGIGLAFRWSLAAAGVAGELIGLQMGIGIASTVDPNSGQGAMLTEGIYALAFSTIFLAFDGHHEVIRSLRASFDAVPPGHGTFNTRAALAIIPQTMAMMSIGIRLAVVVMLPLFLVSVGIALVSRAFPQANVYSLGYSVTLMMGLVLMASAGPSLQAVVMQGIRTGTHDAVNWLQWFVAR